MMQHIWITRIAGGLAGLANGLFGGGGGMVFVPILARWGTLSQRQLYATCVGVIFLPSVWSPPPCIFCGAVYRWQPRCPIWPAALWAAGVEILRQSPHRMAPAALFAAFLFTRG